MNPADFVCNFNFIYLKVNLYTLPETNVAPENRPKPNRKVVFQPSIFRGYVSLREGFIYIYIYHSHGSCGSAQVPWFLEKSNHFHCDQQHKLVGSFEKPEKHARQIELHFPKTHRIHVWYI